MADFDLSNRPNSGKLEQLMHTHLKLLRNGMLVRNSTHLWRFDCPEAEFWCEMPRDIRKFYFPAMGFGVSHKFPSAELSSTQLRFALEIPRRIASYSLHPTQEISPYLRLLLTRSTKTWYRTLIVRCKIAQNWRNFSPPRTDYPALVAT